MGWLLFYSGITKVFDSSWTSKGYLENASTFSGLYDWLTGPQNIVFIDFVVQWGMVLLGAALILGLFTRLAAGLAAVLMMLYYFPVLDFPYAGQNGFLIDEHIIYALAFLLLIRLKAGRSFGIGSLFGRNSY